MARSRFGGQSADVIWDTILVDIIQQVPKLGSFTMTFWNAKAGGTQYTDVTLDSAGTLPTGGVVTTTPDGHIPIVYGPDGVLEMWIDAGGTRWLMVTSDAANLSGAVTSATAQATAAASSATAASTSASTATSAAASVSRETNNGIAGLDASGKLTAVTRLPDLGRPRTGVQPVGQGELVFNVKDAPYSAPNNGTSDDSTAINAAISAANAAGGGDVLVPWSATNYMLGAQLTMKANVRLVLGGNLKLLAAHTGRAIIATNISNIAIVGLPGGGIIDLNKAATTRGANNTNQQALLAQYTSGAAFTGLTVQGLTIKNGWWRGLSVIATAAGSAISDVLIERNTVTACEESSIVVGLLGNTDKVSRSLSQGIVLRRNTINMVTGTTANGLNGIMVYGCSQIEVRGNLIYGNSVATGQGITLGTTGSGLQATDFLIEDNKVYAFVTAAKWGIVATVNATRFKISRNLVDGCTGGITVDPEDSGAVGVEVVLAGSVVDNTAINSTASHGINARVCNGLQILGNQAKGNFLSGIAVTSATGVVVDNNNTFSNGQHGIAFFGSTSGGHFLGTNRSTGNNTRAVGAVDLYMDPTLATPVTSQLGLSGGKVGFYGATPVVKAAAPGAASGTDAAVINALTTALRNLGLVT